MPLPDKSQPWIQSAFIDSIFILSPPFVALLIVALFPASFKNSETMPLVYWVVLIVMIDVAHVYSTLYRTYFNPAEFKSRQPLLLAIPLFCYVGGVILYSFDGMIFWRVLAYLAVFHFVRQQYGFMRLYSRTSSVSKMSRNLDTAAIYIATLYPLLYWHFNSKRNFNWFISGDFKLFHSAAVLLLSLYVYIAIVGFYIIKEIVSYIQTKRLNVPKNFIIAGTLLSWYFGIVYYNGDIAFTTLNVVSHGIPYMALIWVYERRKYHKQETKKTTLLRLTFSRYGALCFVGLLILFAYLEEGLWDGLIWKEHGSFFKPFAWLPAVTEAQALCLLVPLLALPQSTHYVLDGFIWKITKGRDKISI